MFPDARAADVEAGIRRAMAKAGVADVGAFAGAAASGRALDELIDELTVRETYFFRDPKQLDFIRARVLPEARRARGEASPVLMWSAGCSSGEEAYSLAILADQEEEAAGGLWRGGARVFATDVSRGAIERARAAHYKAWSLRAAPPGVVARYFRADGDGFRLVERVREKVTIARLNLLTDPYPSSTGEGGALGFDLILCRNVFIYMDEASIRRVAERLYAALCEGGWLVTGASDPPLHGFAPFEVALTEGGVMYRRGEGPARRAVGRAVTGAGTRTGAGSDAGSDAGSVTGAATVTAMAAATVTATAAATVTVTAAVTETEAATEAAPEAAARALLLARGAFAEGDYARAAVITREHPDDPDACAIRVRAIANLSGPAAAERACAEVVSRHPLCVELHYLHAAALLEEGRDAEAARAARRVIYLDRSAAAAHFTLGAILRRRGDIEGARRAFRNARDLLVAMPEDARVPLADGEVAGRMAAAARAELSAMEGKGKVPR
jgi:chemotaxis protein methyltransferase CheR